VAQDRKLGPKAKISLTERLSYGFGDLGTSLAYNMASGFLLYYYTNLVRLPAASVGTVFLVARLLDAVIDMAVGIGVVKPAAAGAAPGRISCSARSLTHSSVCLCSACRHGRRARNWSTRSSPSRRSAS